MVEMIAGFGVGCSLSLGMVVYGLWQRLQWVLNENDELRQWCTMLTIKGGNLQATPEVDDDLDDITGG